MAARTKLTINDIYTGIFSLLGHVHSASDITSGTIDSARLPAIAGNITVEEIDGVPTVSGVTTIRVSNGKLTDNGGGTVTMDLAGGATASTPPGIKVVISKTFS